MLLTLHVVLLVAANVWCAWGEFTCATCLLFMYTFCCRNLCVLLCTLNGLSLWHTHFPCANENFPLFVACATAIARARTLFWLLVVVVTIYYIVFFFLILLLAPFLTLSPTQQFLYSATASCSSSHIWTASRRFFAQIKLNFHDLLVHSFYPTA